MQFIMELLNTNGIISAHQFVSCNSSKKLKDMKVKKQQTSYGLNSNIIQQAICIFFFILYNIQILSIENIFISTLKTMENM